MLVVRRKQNQFPSFSNLVDDFFNSDFEKYFIPKTNSPLVNIVESEQEFGIELRVPGFAKEDIEISVKDNTLTIASKKKEEKNNESEENGFKYKRREFFHSEFSRSFELPEEVNAEEIKAKFENGILRVSLPKSEPKPEVVQQIAID